MKSFEIVDDSGLADISSVAEFCRVSPDDIRRWARRQWTHKRKNLPVAVACDRSSRRLLYSAEDVLQIVAQTRHRR